jgi:hypothetical protein
VVLACQAHPEFLSTPRDGHPLFIGFIRAARERKAGGKLLSKRALTCEWGFGPILHASTPSAPARPVLRTTRKRHETVDSRSGWTSPCS